MTGIQCNCYKHAPVSAPPAPLPPFSPPSLPKVPTLTFDVASKSSILRHPGLPESPLNLWSNPPESATQLQRLCVNGVRHSGTSVPRRPSTVRQSGCSMHAVGRRPSSSHGCERDILRNLDECMCYYRTTVSFGSSLMAPPERGSKAAVSPGPSASFSGLGNSDNVKRLLNPAERADEATPVRGPQQPEDFSFHVPPEDSSASTATTSGRQHEQSYRHCNRWDSDKYNHADDGDDGPDDVVAFGTYRSVPPSSCAAPGCTLGAFDGVARRVERDSPGRQPSASRGDVELYVKAPGERGGPFFGGGVWESEGQGRAGGGKRGSHTTSFSRWCIAPSNGNS